MVGQQGLRIAHPVLLCHLCLHLHTSGTSANSYSGPPIRPLGDKCQQSRRLRDNGLGRRPTQGPAGARGLWSSVSVCSGCANRIPWTEWLGHRHLFLILLKAVKSKIHVPADSVSGEDPLPGLQKATFLLCPHTVKREFFPLMSLVRALIPSWDLSLSHGQLINSQEPHLLILSHWKLGFYHINWGGAQILSL